MKLAESAKSRSRILSRVLLSCVLAFAVGSARSEDKRCLDGLYPEGTSRDTADFEFDKSFVGDSNGAYSCSLGMRPSELRKALDRFRAGVLYHDPIAVGVVLRFPIQAHVSNTLKLSPPSKEITIRNVVEWFAFQEKYFSKTHTALVACSYLENVTPIGGRSPGVMIGLGAFWFQSFAGNRTVKMTAVNIFPVDATMLAKSCIPPGAEGN